MIGDNLGFSLTLGQRHAFWSQRFRATDLLSSPALIRCHRRALSGQLACTSLSGVEPAAVHDLRAVDTSRVVARSGDFAQLARQAGYLVVSQVGGFCHVIISSDEQVGPFASPQRAKHSPHLFMLFEGVVVNKSV